MIKFEKRNPGSIIDNFIFNISGTTMFELCSKYLDGFPEITLSFEELFNDVYGFDTEVDEVTSSIFLSDILNQCFEMIKNNKSFTVPTNIPLIVVYRLVKRYGLVPFENLFTTIQNDAEFVPPNIWEPNSFNSINLKDLKNCYGKVNICYNTKDVPKFITYFTGSLEDLPDQEVSVYISGASKSGTTSKVTNGTLTIPASYMKKNAKFTQGSVGFKNFIQQTDLDDTYNFGNGSLTTTDGINISTKVYRGGFDSRQTKTYYYYMWKETNVSSILKRFFESNGISLDNVNWKDFPYDKFIYEKPGDSKVVKNQNKTLLSDTSVLKNAKGPYINDPAKCCCDRKNGTVGNKFHYNEINGWTWTGGSQKFSETDKKTVSSSNFEISYYRTDPRSFRKGNILNQEVYEDDKGGYVGKWKGDGTLYLENSYSYGEKVGLEKNPRTACSFKFATTIRAVSSDQYSIFQQLGTIAIYSFVNEVLELFKDNWKLITFFERYLEYQTLARSKNLGGIYEEYPFVNFIIVQNGKTSYTDIDKIVEKYGDEFKLIVSQTDSETNEKLYELHLPKLEIVGTTFRFSSSKDSDFNRYFIYGSKSVYQVKNLPIKINENITVDNTFLIHNHIFSGSCPNVLLNFNPWD